VSEEALAGGIRGGLVRSVSKRRWVQLIIEAEYDAIVWTGGLFVAARAVGALSGGYLTTISFWAGWMAFCLLVAGCGLAAGQYRRRYLRGSREEVEAVLLACVLTVCCLAAAGLAVVTERRAPLETVVGGAAVAVAAMLGARYVVFAASLRLRPAAGRRVSVIAIPRERQDHSRAHRGRRALRSRSEGDPFVPGTAHRPGADPRCG
jgi:hypothetical protein